MLFYWCSCINTRAELLNQVTLEDETSTPQRRQGYIRHLDGLLWPWPSRFNLQNLTRSSARANEYWLSVLAKLFKTFVRYRGGRTERKQCLRPHCRWRKHDWSTRWNIKKCHFIFHYHSGTSWWIFTLHVPAKTGMNTLYNSYKICNLTLTMSSIVAMVSAVRNDRGRWPQFNRIGCAQLSQKIIQCNVVSTFLLQYSLASLWAENLLDLRGFDQNFIFRTQHIFIFHFTALSLHTK